METSPKRQVNRLLIAGSAIFVVLLGLVVLKIGGPQKPSYSFVTVDHPVDMWRQGSDKWSYFYVGGDSLEALAGKARADLVPRGFTEDTTQRPWFRFVRGNKEVVVCNHHDFAVNGSLTGSTLTKGVWNRGVTKPTKASPCVLVKNGPGTETSVPAFAIKKLVYRW